MSDKESKKMRIMCYTKLITLVFIFVFLEFIFISIQAFAEERSVFSGSECTASKEICIPAGSKCISSGERVIDGVKIHRDCWEYDIEYDCFDEEMTLEDECLALRNKGCEQINSKCVEERAGYCILHEQTFRCKEGTECTNVERLDCLNEVSFCADRNCLNGLDEEFEKSHNFGEAISQLSAVFESAKDFAASFKRKGGNHPMIFAGQVGECSMAVLEFRNCCRDYGWGLSLKLSDCPEEAERVGVAKGKSQAVYIGKYCAHKVLGKCIEYKKSYCLFSSRLARIIQEQGRAQLGISWGDAEDPNCRGLTIEELQQLHFDEMNFNEFFEYELKGKTHYPSAEEVQALKNHFIQTVPNKQPIRKEQGGYQIRGKYE
jgi:conjugal transfer mating pair stabilization protein TraN